MSWNTGGIIFKARAALDTSAMLDALAICEGDVDIDPSVDDATSSRYLRIGMYTKDQTAWLFGFNISLNCGFEAELTKFEQRLASLSRAGDVFLFHLDGHSDTYGWSMFQAGARTVVRSFVPNGHEVIEYSEGTLDRPANEDGIFDLFGEFGGMGMYDLYEYTQRPRS